MTTGILQELTDEQTRLFVPLDARSYEALIEQGGLPEDATMELLDGFLIRKDRRDGDEDIMNHGTQHARAVAIATDTIAEAVRPSGFHVQEQLPLNLGVVQRPEPDAAVVRGRRRDYEDRHPQAGDVALVVEVAASSLRFDRTTKQRIYAQAGLPTYWIINVTKQCVEVFEKPDSQADPARYTSQQSFSRGEFIELKLDGNPVRIAVDDLLVSVPHP